jgi:hypothetical protein
MALLRLLNERESEILIEGQAWQFIIDFDLYLGRDDSQRLEDEIFNCSSRSICVFL